MKKVISLLAVILLIVSCEGPMGPRGPQGPQGESSKSKSFDFVIHPNMWEPVYDSNNGLFLYYHYIKALPELDRNIFEKGMFCAYLRDYDNHGNPIQKPLTELGFGEDGDGHLWQENICCDFSIGDVAFYVKYNDFNEGRPGRMDFRVVLMW